MFKRGDAVTGQVDTLIGKQSVFEGTLKASGSVRIEGSLRGEVSGDADVVIGESGRVVANVQAKNVVLAGEVQGDVVAAGRAYITSSGRLYGNLTTKSLVIDEGAIFQGTCHTQDAKAVAVPREEPA